MKWMSFLWNRKRREQVLSASATACPHRGGNTILMENYTTMGDDIRTYRCVRCQKEHAVDSGVALWKAMSEANKPAPGE